MSGHGKVGKGYQELAARYGLTVEQGARGTALVSPGGMRWQIGSGRQDNPTSLKQLEARIRRQGGYPKR